jgi:ABC-type multidrug transport system permease subunit
MAPRIIGIMYSISPPSIGVTAILMTLLVFTTMLTASMIAT